jgi:inosine-uridine nucleoside N-ribohydrolase
MNYFKVYKGAAAPLLKSKLNCPIIHGESGLDGHDFPDPTYEHEKGPALLHLYNAIMNASQKVHICATGAMTNIALLVKGFPDCLDKIE